ncbi:Interference hedgehog [Nymphon striatum]|nr:Interference hedgehog [Nymphon striatum]
MNISFNQCLHLWNFSTFLLLCFLTKSLVAALNFETEPSSLLVLPTGRAVFKCSADNPEAKVQWKRDGQFIKHDPTQGIQINQNKLVVRAITSHSTVLSKLHSATFQCVISHQGVTLLSQQAKLIVAELSKFPPQEDVYVSVIKGNVAVIPCKPPHSVPVAVTEFLVNNRTRIFKSNGRFSLLPSGNLHISNVRKTDEGIYRCIVNNPFLGHKITSFHRIHLKVKNSKENKDIKFTHHPPQTIGVVTGSNLTIECAATGYPVPRISWVKRKDKLPKNRHQIIAGNLLLINVQIEDAGIYSCVATNGVSNGVTSVVTVNINELPEITEYPGKLSVKEKSAVSLNCEVTGHPKPTVTWIYNGRLLTRSRNVVIRSDNTLIINEINSRLTGAYQCFASNELASTYRTSFIEIESKISNTKDSLENTNLSSEEIKKRKSNQNNDRDKKKRKKGRRRKGRRKNRKKDRNKQTGQKNKPVSGKMVSPARPEITKLTDHSVMVRWEVPNNDGLPIQFFKIQYKDLNKTDIKDGTDWKTITEEIEPHVNSYEILDLDTEHSYRFRVAAVFNDDHKFSPNSYKFNLVKDPPMKKPVSSPMIVSAEGISPSALIVKWEFKQRMDEVEVDGFFIYYRSTHTAGDYTKMTVLGTNTRTHIIDHLLPNIPYEMKMQCFNMAGTSDFSNIFTAKTKSMQFHLWPFLCLSESVNSSVAEDNIVNLDAGHHNVKVPSDTHTSSQLLYTIVGSVFGVITIIVIVFVCICACKPKRESLPSELDHAIHSKYQDTSAHIHESHHLNGGLLTRNTPLKNHISGVQNGYLSHDCGNKVNISVNPLSFDTNEGR